MVGIVIEVFLLIAVIAVGGLVIVVLGVLVVLIRVARVVLLEPTPLHFRL